MKSLSDFRPYITMYVDAMNLLARSFYGMPMLEYKGKKTGMLMGVARLIIEWRRKYPELHIIFVWEGENNWRKAAQPIYKANRDKNNAQKPLESKLEFRDSLAVVKESLPAMGVNQVLAETFEADDTVWTVMRMTEGKKLFVSTDWDWWSLVDYGDILYENTVMTEIELNAKFTKKYNCEPIPMSRIWMFKVLTGDPSDNISGVPMFPKKIAAILTADKSLTEDILIQGMIDHGYPKWADKTTKHKWVFDRNLELVRIVPPPIEDLEWVMAPEYSEAAFGDVLLKYGMGYLHGRLIGV
jgi:5'-3' exonuclease